MAYSLMPISAVPVFAQDDVSNETSTSDTDGISVQKLPLPSLPEDVAKVMKMIYLCYPDSSSKAGYGFPDDLGVLINKKNSFEYTIPANANPRKKGFKCVGFQFVDESGKQLISGTYKAGQKVTIPPDVADTVMVMPVYEEDASMPDVENTSDYINLTPYGLILQSVPVDASGAKPADEQDETEPSDDTTDDIETQASRIKVTTNPMLVIISKVKKGPVSVTLPDWPSSLLSEGQKFAGYASSETAAAPDLKPGDKFTQTGRIETVYALLTADKPADEQVTVTLSANGDTFKTVQGKAGAKVKLPAETPAKDGYEFLGWASKDNAETAEYQAGAEITLPDKSGTLYAVWKKAGDTPVTPTEQEIQISFSAEGATGIPENTTVKAALPYTYTLPAETPVKENSKFTGWKYDGKIYQASEKVIITATPAVFEAIFDNEATEPTVEYSVSFDANGGSGAPAKITSDKADVKIPTAVPSRDGYKFLGWATKADATSATLQPGDTVQAAEAGLTLYAVWQKNETPKVTYTLTFNANGGEGAPEQITSDTSTTTVPDTKPTREGYTFLGWATKADAEVAGIQPGEKIMISRNGTTLYAIWRKANEGSQGNSGNTNKPSGSDKQETTISVNFNAGEGTGEPMSLTFKGTLPYKYKIPAQTPSRQGYTFAGWDYNGKTVLPSAEVELKSAENNFTAVWKKGSAAAGNESNKNNNGNADKGSAETNKNSVSGKKESAQGKNETTTQKTVASETNTAAHQDNSWIPAALSFGALLMAAAAWMIQRMKRTH